MNDRLMFALLLWGIGIVALAGGILMVIYFSSLIAKIPAGLTAIVGFISLMTGTGIATGKL